MTASVSLVITHYKQFRFLSKLIRYASENDWLGAGEVIIIDDCSMGSIEIREINEKYPTVQLYINTENKGPSFSRNFGVSKSKLEYIQFLDADDWITPDKIKIQYRSAITLNYPSFICSQWARVKLESNYDEAEIINSYVPNLSTPTLINIMSNFFPLMSGLILRESFLEVNGFREDMRLIEDVNLEIRLYYLKRDFQLHETDKPLFFYRVNNPNSLSNSNQYQFNNAVLTNYKLCFEYAKNLYTKDEIAGYKSLSFPVLWHIYLNACTLKNTKLINSAVHEMKSLKIHRSAIKEHGKKLLLTRALGFKFASFILRLC